MISAIIIFIFGLMVGSFLNVCIYRIPRGESIISPGSRCPHCANPIKVRDNIPVISFLLLKGRCRYCGEKISLRYPAVELLTAFLFLAAYLKLSFQPSAVAEGFSLPFLWRPEGLRYMLKLTSNLQPLASVLFFLAVLILVSFIDLEHKIIPNKVILPSMAVGILLVLAFEPGRIRESLIGALIGGGFLLFIALIRREGMGGGDIKLAGLMGIFLGGYILLALFLGFFFGALAGIILIVLKLKSRKDLIPFGPFLALGAVVTLFFGQSIVQWYLRAFV